RDRSTADRRPARRTRIRGHAACYRGEPRRRAAQALERSRASRRRCDRDHFAKTRRIEARWLGGAVTMLKLYDQAFSSRLLLGTALYPSPKVMQDAIRASGAEIVTVSLRRE